MFLVLIEIPGTFERRELTFKNFKAARDYASNIPRVLKFAGIVGAWREPRRYRAARKVTTAHHVV